MNRKILMGGICGMGMAPLAAFLKNSGENVSGFDDSPDLNMSEWLKHLGVKIGKLDDFKGKVFDECVISSALKRRIGELERLFPNLNIKLRGEKWSEICSSRRLAAVTGSHGKSSVSALLAHAILKTGKSGSGFLVGAIPLDFKPEKYSETGQILVSEIDESDGTIEKFSPEICTALNGDLDHVDTYPDKKSLEKMFSRLFSRTSKSIVIPSGDDLLVRAAKNSNAKVRIVDVSPDEDFDSINRKMAAATFEEIFEEKVSKSIFDDYGGLLRRQEILASGETFTAVADYAHHPRELRAFLKWLSEKYPDKAKFVLFQPHRYTRTKRFAEDFARELVEFSHRELSLGNPCEIRLTKVYAASEPFDQNSESDKISEAAEKLSPDTAYFPKNILQKNEIKNFASEALKSKNSVFAVVGAGDAYFDAKKFFAEARVSSGKFHAQKI